MTSASLPVLVAGTVSSVCFERRHLSQNPIAECRGERKSDYDKSAMKEAPTVQSEKKGDRHQIPPQDA